MVSRRQSFQYEVGLHVLSRTQELLDSLNPQIAHAFVDHIVIGQRLPLYLRTTEDRLYRRDRLTYLFVTVRPLHVKKKYGNGCFSDGCIL